jgi:hypothetical protein
MALGIEVPPTLHAGLTLGNEIDKLANNIAVMDPGGVATERQYQRPLRRRATGAGSLAGLQPHLQRTLRRLCCEEVQRRQGEDHER